MRLEMVDEREGGRERERGRRGGLVVHDVVRRRRVCMMMVWRSNRRMER